MNRNKLERPGRRGAILNGHYFYSGRFLSRKLSVKFPLTYSVRLEIGLKVWKVQDAPRARSALLRGSLFALKLKIPRSQF